MTSGASHKIVILHFQPLEYYPPVQNLIRVLEAAPGEFELWVFTSGTRRIGLKSFMTKSDRVRIFRLGSQGSTQISRFVNYSRFYLGGLVWLLLIGPSRILYFETISSFPAYIYKRLFRSSLGVLIHYHEYVTAEEYDQGPKLIRYFHQWEKWLYGKALWISHTNEARMERFEADILPVKIDNVRILPNFPPRSWYHPAKSNMSFPLKIIYAGALSLETMYTKEFATWVVGQNGNVLWHIYSLNMTESAKRFLESLNTDWIVLKDGVDYEELPSVLSQFDIGVILYKGHILNYVYNAPNKLFEYLACGLSVVFPDVMVGSLPYCTSNAYPFVTSLNFEALRKWKPEVLIDSSSMTRTPANLFCEDALAPLVDTLVR